MILILAEIAPAVIFDFQNHMQGFISEQAAAAAASGGQMKDLPSFLSAVLLHWRRPQLREGPVIQQDLLYSSRFLKYVLYIHNVYVLYTCHAEGLYAYLLYFSRRKIDDIDILPTSGRCACIAQFSMYCTL